MQPMAIAQEMAETVASLAGKPATATINHLRNLRDAGLISKNGRGPSAARMDVDDAVMLLLATAGTERLKDSVSVAEELSSLRTTATSQTWHRKEWRTAGRTILVLPSDHTLADALRCAFYVSALVLGLKTGSAAEYVLLPMAEIKRKPILFVEICYPSFSATVEIEVPRTVRETWRYGPRRPKTDKEFTRSCRFGSATFDALNKLLAKP
jgi:hypothetical protein